ncbi:orexin receptor type 2-like isoform X2 [Mercenaria mercenaria]|nr:orexin receptor type 2-like isoform X2 [Mercenaria mercenaria]
MSSNGTMDSVTVLTPTVSAHDLEETLDHYNEIQALRYFPVFVFLVIIMIVGTVGNALVLYVYRKRFRKTSSNYFIVSMAVFDLLACLIGLPTELYDLRFSYTFYNSALCKIFRYSNTVVTYGSAIILVQIAFDRYFKICRPLMMIELYKIKAMCISAGIIAVLISIPALVLFGISRTPTPDENYQGYDCSVEESYKKKAFSIVYYYLLAIVFVTTVIVLTALYIRIWIEIKRRQKLVIGDPVRTSQREEIPMNQSSIKDSKTRKLRVRYCSEFSDEDTQEVAPRTIFRPRLLSLAEAVTRFRVSRTTVVLFAVTVAFVISYMPGIIIMICRSVIKDLESKQTVTEQVFSKLFSKFNFLNNAINPIIYSFLNVSFRRRCVTVIKQLVFCRRNETVRRPIPDKTDSQKSHKSTKSNKSTKNEEQRYIKNGLPMWFDIKVARMDPKTCTNQPKLTIYIR